MDRTSSFRRSDQLFVTWANPNKGKPIKKQHLSHWVVEANALAYRSHGSQPPMGLQAPSTWLHPEPDSGEFLFRTCVLRRVGPRLSFLFGSVFLTFPLHVGHGWFCCPRNRVFFPVGRWTRDKFVWQYGSFDIEWVLWKRTLGHVHNPSSLNNMSEKSHHTTLHAWGSEKRSLFWMRWYRPHELFKVSGTTWCRRTHSPANQDWDQWD